MIAEWRDLSVPTLTQIIGVLREGEVCGTFVSAMINQHLLNFLPISRLTQMGVRVPSSGRFKKKNAPMAGGSKIALTKLKDCLSYEERPTIQNQMNYNENQI